MNKIREWYRKHKRGFLATTLCGLVAIIALPALAINIGTGMDHVIFEVVASGTRSDGGNGGFWDYNTYYKEAADGTPAYCLNNDKKQPSGQDYTEGGQVNNRVYTIMMNGYPNKRFSDNGNADFYITQLAIWHELGQLDHGEPVKWFAVPEININADQAKAAYEQLCATADNAPQTQDIALDFAKTDYVATQDKNLKGYVTEPIELQLTGNVSSTDLDVIVTSDATPNTSAYAINNAGERVTKISSSEPIRIVVPYTEPKGTLTVSASGTVIHKVGLTYTTQDSSLQNMGMVREADIEGSVRNSARVTWNEVRGEVRIKKADSENRKLLAGAEFSIWQGDQKISSEVTNANGIARFPNLLIGKYTIKEDKPAVGYLPTDQTWEAEVTGESTEAITIDIANKPVKFMLKVVKTDGETTEPLKGASFQLYSVPEGEEEKPDLEVPEDPNNPKPADEEGTTEGEETKPEEDLTAGQKPISFTYELNGEQVTTDTFETDDNGEITFPEALRLGKYKLVEVQAPTGYKGIEPVEFEVTPDTEFIEGTEIPYYVVEVKNYIGSGKLQITKKDVSTGELLPNTHFVIYGPDGTTVVDKGVTDANGLAEFMLPVGKYYYQEFQAPEGYQIDSSLFPFEIKEDGEIVKCEMTNTKIPKTGDISREFIAPALGIVVLGGIYLVIRKRREAK